ncbi:CRISPR-associated helicase/endonuclease Cas3 [Corynebacterium glutamicum]|uniref:CRISPR-associated helicase Cas3 n=1 Tax=Corynebacterium glutamicum (strain R) TaxID=340322 RepID=A0AB72VFI3_CORGB|nr:CRISPR-associated helicase/endonuclease Cas3 [Corynebacterium glutamicum]BAQ21112.1 CRISPR-associated helicase Cas3 [Corynebacterium glutamicum R]
MSQYEELWAKKEGLPQPYPLLAHLLDSAAMGQTLFDYWLRSGLQDLIREELGPKTREIVGWIIGIHDLGKANPVFQGQPGQQGDDWEAIRKKIINSGNCSFPPTLFDAPKPYLQDNALRRHEQQTALYFSENWPIENGEIEDQWNLIPVLGHHGYFEVPFLKPGNKSKTLRRRKPEFERLGWFKAQADIEAQLLKGLNLNSDEIPSRVSSTVSILLSGLTILADRLASQLTWIEASQQKIKTTEKSLSTPVDWINSTYEPAIDIIKQNLGIYKNGGPNWNSHILKGYEPRKAQKLAMEAGDGLEILMAPTGNGKTEAALLRHAQKDERLIFLLPTQATTNAMMKRVQKAFEGTPNVSSLAHSLATIEDFYETPVTTFEDTEKGCDSGGLFPNEFVRRGLSRLLASVTVATVDQALKGALQIKWSHLLLLSLANSHIVIDEAHTLEHYQSELLSNLLPWLGATHTRVTLLTATLPTWQAKKFLAAYNKFSLDSELEFPALLSAERQQHFETPPYTIDTSIDEVAANAIEEAHVSWVLHNREKYPLARIGVICNQIERAQSIAQRLLSQGENTIVLHSAMTAEHRRINAQALEEALGPNGKSQNITLIGTQAVEASLDIDLDLLSSDLCPSTSLLQRAGRVWRRHDPTRKNRIPEINNLPLRIVAPENYKTGAHLPYFAAELELTKRWISQFETIEMPKHAQELVDTASVTFNKLIDEENDLIDELSDQFSAQSLKKNAALTRINSLSSLIQNPTSLSEIIHLTGTRETSQLQDREERSTRYIETETIQLILGDSTGQIPGAWTEGIEALSKIQSNERSQTKRALRASIPVSKSRLPQTVLDKTEPISEKGLLSQYLFLNAQPFYDSNIGFIIHKD